MTKSQNTKNEQQKDLCITSEQLTEQWKEKNETAYILAKGITERNEKIDQLKELLKECREVIKNVDTYYGNYDSTNGYLVINKIDEVLR